MYLTKENQYTNDWNDKHLGEDYDQACHSVSTTNYSFGSNYSF